MATDSATLAELARPVSMSEHRSGGFPLSAAEEEQLDLNGRIKFADAVSRTVLPFARSLPTYGGAYIDQRGDGSLVVLLTELDPSVVDSIQDLAPDDPRSVRVQLVQHTESELRAAVLRARDDLPNSMPGVSIESIGVDTVRNGLRVTVSGSGQVASTAGRLSRLP